MAQDKSKEKGHVVEETIPVKDLATWQVYEDDQIAFGSALKDPRVLKK